MDCRAERRGPFIIVSGQSFTCTFVLTKGPFLQWVIAHYCGSGLDVK